MPDKDKIYEAVQAILSTPKSTVRKDSYNMDCNDNHEIFGRYVELVETHSDTFSIFGISVVSGALYRGNKRVYWS